MNEQTETETETEKKETPKADSLTRSLSKAVSKAIVEELQRYYRENKTARVKMSDVASGVWVGSRIAIEHVFAKQEAEAVFRLIASAYNASAFNPKSAEKQINQKEKQKSKIEVFTR